MGVGAPSYTSGAHMWNGTAAILKPMPAATRISASISQGSRPRAATASASARRFVVPDMPYRIEIPYRRMPRENAPSRKYFTAASFDRRSGLSRPARM